MGLCFSRHREKLLRAPPPSAWAPPDRDREPFSGKSPRSPLCSNQSPENTTFKGSGPWRKERRPPPPPRPEVRFSPEGAPLPRTRTQLLSNVGAEALQPEPSNSRAAAFSTNQRRPRLTRLTNQRRRRKEVSRAFEEGPLNSNSSAR